VLDSALSHYRHQQLITAAAVREARMRLPRGAVAVVRGVNAYQLASINLTIGSTDAELAEQGLRAPSVASVNTPSLLTSGTSLTQMVEATATSEAFDRLVASLVQDAGRTAAAMDLARRPALTGHVRSLNLPSCSRCVILAGRVYRYSEGFKRHPLCDCLMTPTTDAVGQDLVTDPGEALARGQVTGLSKGDLKAIENGADLGKVVNVRSKKAGLTVGSSVITRGGRLTPQGVMKVASDRTEALLPPTITGPIFAKATEQSAVMSLARRVPLSVNAHTAIPVPMDVPVADWVGEGGVKPAARSVSA
jgi:hypothetical protein